jgi:sugar phosphate isomerase/epimerase
MGPAMSAADRQQLLAYLKEKGVVLIAYGVVDGTDETKTESDWKNCFAFAKDMGIKLITAMPTKGQLDLVNALSRQYQIPVAIHGEPGENAYSRPDSVAKAIENRPNLGACVDIGNWTRNGVDVLDCVKHQLRGRIFSLHLKDVQESGSRRAAEVPLGHGIIPIPAILDELKAQGFSGIFSIEHPSHQGPGHVEDIREDERYFRGQLHRLGQMGS